MTKTMFKMIQEDLEGWILLLNIVTSHTTDFKSENDQNKPQNDILETSLWSFLAVQVVSKLYFIKHAPFFICLYS